MSTQLPLISCVCVTKGKPHLLKRAIACFSAQNYPNKELVVLYEEEDTATEQFIGTGFPSGSDIRVFRVPSRPKTALGELRNYVIGLAGGEYICQWDDDDWYHMNRLSAQYSKMVEGHCEGSIMTQWLVFDSLTTRAYISNVRLWEGSLLCRKSVLQLKPYENKVMGEDTATVDYLASEDRLHPLNELPELYIYVYHGHNTWSYEHWSAIFRCSVALSVENSQSVLNILDGKYSVYEGSLMLDALLTRPATSHGVPPIFA